MKVFNLKFNFRLVIIAVITLLIFFHYLRVLSPLENLLIKVFSPLQAKIYSLAVTTNDKFFSPSAPVDDLKQENERLRQQIEELILENAELKIQNEENKILEEQLKLVKKFDQDYVSCRVISKQFTVNSDILVLNCGAETGVKEGLPAVAGQGVIVGKVIEVKAAISRLLLITSRGSKIGATILNQERTTGIVTGGKDSSLRMKFIPRDIEIELGEIIVTSTLEENIPANLAIGRVEEVSSQANSFFQTATIKPAVNLENISIVSILLPPVL